MEAAMEAALAARRAAGTLRMLGTKLGVARATPVVDFSSNDYLGLARCSELCDAAVAEARRWGGDGRRLLGSTGSRLLTGDSPQARELEDFLCGFHAREAALLFSSGYDANLGLLSSVPLAGDAVFRDELAHNSVVIGTLLGRQSELCTFRHNDVAHLSQLLSGWRRKQQQSTTMGVSSSRAGNALIAVESVYSMDGDLAPLAEILDAAAEAGASVVVDEAHATGIIGPGGRGLVAALGLEMHPALLASVHTFGKALGAHGAAVLGSKTLRSYLCNYARPLIYSTAPPPHALAAARCAYRAVAGPDGERRRRRALHLSQLLRKSLVEFPVKLQAHRPVTTAATLQPPPLRPDAVIAGESAIVAVLLPGASRVVEASKWLQSHGLDVLPIRAPTVAAGTERLRVCVHAHNSEAEIFALAHHLRVLFSALDAGALKDDTSVSSLQCGLCSCGASGAGAKIDPKCMCHGTAVGLLEPEAAAAVLKPAVHLPEAASSKRWQEPAPAPRL